MSALARDGSSQLIRNERRRGFGWLFMKKCEEHFDGLARCHGCAVSSKAGPERSRVFVAPYETWNQFCFGIVSPYETLSISMICSAKTGCSNYVDLCAFLSLSPFLLVFIIVCSFTEVLSVTAWATLAVPPHLVSPTNISFRVFCLTPWGGGCCGCFSTSGAGTGHRGFCAEEVLLWGISAQTRQLNLSTCWQSFRPST